MTAELLLLSYADKCDVSNEGSLSDGVAQSAS